MNKKLLFNIIILNIMFLPCLFVFNTEWSVFWNVAGLVYSAGYARLIKKLFGNLVKDESELLI